MIPYIFTEIVNCGKIGRIAIDSFHKFHKLPVHIYGTHSDFNFIIPHPDNILIPVGSDIIDGYKEGHLGTARLWASLIQTLDIKTLIHFDSDVIFRDKIVDDIIIKSHEYDLVGGIRNYKNNPHNMEEVKSLSDVVSTALFSFNRTLVTKHPISILIKMCRGTYNPLGHPTIDFFDPVSFDILKNGGKITFIDSDDIGACNEAGSRDNIFKEINNGTTPFKIDFGKKLAHFSAVGSGMNFFNNPRIDTPMSYKQYALDRYALFCKIFYNENLEIDLSQYKKILEIKDWY